MSTKIRPPNGPGSNGLRGGLNTYSPKTTTGQWLEEFGGTSRYKRGFSTVDFETEAQHAQSGALREKVREYGAGLPLTEIVVHKPNNAEVFNPPTASNATRWQTNSQLMNKDVYNKSSTAEVLMTPKLPRDKLEEYRNHWTTDTETGRTVRFQTESRLAGNCANNKFQVSSIRYLPGAPKSAEEYRSRVVERFGTFAVAALKFHVGGGDISVQEFRTALNGTKVAIKTFEFNQIVAFVATSTDYISCEKFIRTITGRVDGFSSESARKVFNRLSRGEGAVSLSTLFGAVDTTVFPEVLEGFKLFSSVYAGDRSSLTESEFLALHEDMYASLPNKYNEIVQSVWQL